MKLNLENHIEKHEECARILEMIKLNRRYMLADLAPSETSVWLYGKQYYQDRVERRAKIQKRLLTYYAKKVAMIGSEAYEVAMALIEPKSSKQ